MKNYNKIYFDNLKGKIYNLESILNNLKDFKLVKDTKKSMKKYVK
jgi:hypothetical protein